MDQLVEASFLSLIIKSINPYPCFAWKYKIYPVWRDNHVDTINSILIPNKDINIIVKLINNCVLSIEEIMSLTLVSESSY